MLARLWRRRRRDGRGGRIVAVIECVLNQNARDDGAARFPAMNAEVVKILRRHRVGVVQMRCPEIACLGPARSRPEGVGLRQAMETSDARRRCRALARDAAERLAACRQNGVEVTAVLGGDVGSPGCAVHHDAKTGQLAPSSGVFMRELAEALAERGLGVPFRGLRDSDPGELEDDLAWLEDILGAAR